MSENEINKVHVLIRRFLYEVDGVIGDKDKCQQWLTSFAKTLQFQDLCEEPNEYAMFLLTEARAFNSAQRRKSQMKQVRRTLKEEGVTNPTKAQLEERWILMYGDDDDSEDKTASDNVLPKIGEEKKRTGGNSLPPVRNSKPLPMPDDKQEVLDFAYAEGLDINDAYECWYCTINDRNGMTADGKPVNNWKAYVRQWCKTREHNRRTA